MDCAPRAEPMLESAGKEDPARMHPDGPPPPGTLDRKLCQVVGLNQNYTSQAGTPYHVQIEDRGPVGHRWTVNGALTGTMEVWLEPSLDGVILNYFLHAEPAGAAAWQLAKMNLAKLNHQRRVAGKRMSFELKQKLEASRPVGMPPPA